MPSSGKPAYFLSENCNSKTCSSIQRWQKSYTQSRITIAIMRNLLDNIIHLSVFLKVGITQAEWDTIPISIDTQELSKRLKKFQNGFI